MVYKKADFDQPHTFYAPKNEGFMLGVNDFDAEVRDTVGTITHPSGVIYFSGHIFQTEDNNLAAYMRKTEAFRLGTFKAITLEELKEVKLTHTKVVETTVSEQDAFSSES